MSSKVEYLGEVVIKITFPGSGSYENKFKVSD